jgi:zinc carboxypeptidase
MGRRFKVFIGFSLAVTAGLILSGCAEGGRPAAPPPIPTLPVQLNQTETPTPGMAPFAAGAATPTAPNIHVPLPTPFPDTPTFSIGQSVEGRDLTVWQFGDGGKTIILVGGIHGGYEANTVWLSNLLIQHFQTNPAAVLPGIRLVIMPLANPDGILRGDGLPGRLNANGVDLNRNWGCDWQPQAVWGEVPVDPGPRAFSEPETIALRKFFLDQMPAAVLFYHSSLSGIYPGGCGAQQAQVEWLGDLLQDSTGYTYERSFSYYAVSGDATNWLSERGVPAAVVELSTKDQPEFERNLKGVIALECYFTDKPTPDPNQLPAADRLCAGP